MTEDDLQDFDVLLDVRDVDYELLGKMRIRSGAVYGRLHVSMAVRGDRGLATISMQVLGVDKDPKAASFLRTNLDRDSLARLLGTSFVPARRERGWS